MGKRRKTASSTLGPLPTFYPTRPTQPPPLHASDDDDEDDEKQTTTTKRKAPSIFTKQSRKDYTKAPVHAVKHSIVQKGKVRDLTLPDQDTIRPAPLYSTQQNIDPTVNKRKAKTRRDEELRKAGEEKDEEIRQKKLKNRSKNVARMSVRAIDREWKKYERELGFTLNKELVRPGLGTVERTEYASNTKDLEFYVVRVEQVNTEIDRSLALKKKDDEKKALSTAKKRKPTSQPLRILHDDDDNTNNVDGDEEEKSFRRPSKYNNQDRDDDNDDDDDTHEKSKRKKRRKREDADADDADEPESIDVLFSRAPGGPNEMRQQQRGGWRQQVQTKEDEYGDEFDESDVARDIHRAVPSAQPWFDLSMDEATVEPTMRLTGYIESTRGLTSYDGQQVPHRDKRVIQAVVYVHGHRPRMYVQLSRAIYENLGLIPRTGFEAGILDQFVDHRTPDAKCMDDVVRDAQQTGILNMTTRVAVRKWLKAFHTSLEAESVKVMQKKGGFRRRCAPYILNARMVWRSPQDGFQNNCLYPFVEVTTCLPDVVKCMRDMIQNPGIPLVPPTHALRYEIERHTGMGIAGLTNIIYDYVVPIDPHLLRPQPTPLAAFECTIRYAEQRFPADLELGGDTWITLPRHLFSLRTLPERMTLGWRMDPDGSGTDVPAVAEFDTSVNHIKVHSQRDRPPQVKRQLPKNYKQLLERTRDFSWSGPVPALSPLYPTLDDRLNIVPDPPQRLAPSSSAPPPTAVYPLPPPPVSSQPRPPETVAVKDPDEKRTSGAPPPERTSFQHPPPESAMVDYSRIVNYPVLAFDIECVLCERDKQRFPDPRQGDEIAAFSLVYGRMGQTHVPDDVEQCYSIVACTRPSSKFENMPNCTLQCFKTERDMLLYLVWVLGQIGAGYIMHYNGDGFDWPYLLDRSIELKLPLLQYWSNIAEPATIHEQVRETAQMGAIIQSDVSIRGVNNIDLKRVVTRLEGDRLTSYTLNNVAKHFIKKNKADVHHTDIPRLYHGTPDQVRRLLHYNIMDSLLCLQLFFKRKYHLNLPHMARATNIQAQHILDMGPSVQSEVAFLIECKLEGFLKSYTKRKDIKEKYKGATVMFPRTGFYFDPIVVMDFASLYPSIMIAFNLCVTTFLTWEMIVAYGLTPDQYFTLYSGRNGEPTYWCKPSLRKGILPEQLKSLLAARKVAKKKMEKATDDVTKDVFNVIQNVLKRGANSIYGITKQMNEALSMTVTFMGRMLINMMKMTVENFMVPANGYGPAQGFPGPEQGFKEGHPVVVYGDTDSIMCWFGPISLEFAFSIGEEINRLSRILLRDFNDDKTLQSDGVVGLTFEKVYRPYLLFAKKRYTGLIYNPHVYKGSGSYTKLDKKGSEAVRSDSCKMQKSIMMDVYDMLLTGRLSSDSASMFNIRALFEHECMERAYRQQHFQPDPKLDCLLSRSAVPASASAADAGANTNANATFHDPFVRWNDPASPYYTAPVPPIVEGFEVWKPEARAAYAPKALATMKLHVPLTTKIVQTRVDIAIQLIRLQAWYLLQGKVDWSKLVLSKSWRKRSYAGGRSLVKEVAHKMALRDPGSAPGMGDRIPYLISLQTKKTLVAQSADDPLYMLRNHVPVNMEHYLERQLKRPFSKMFIVILKTMQPHCLEVQPLMYLDPTEENDQGEWVPQLAPQHAAHAWDDARREIEATTTTTTAASKTRPQPSFVVPTPDRFHDLDGKHVLPDALRNWLTRMDGPCVLRVHNVPAWKNMFLNMGLGAGRDNTHARTNQIMWTIFEWQRQPDEQTKETLWVRPSLTLLPKTSDLPQMVGPRCLTLDMAETVNIPKARLYCLGRTTNNNNVGHTDWFTAPLYDSVVPLPLLGLLSLYIETSGIQSVSSTSAAHYEWTGHAMNESPCAKRHACGTTWGQVLDRMEQKTFPCYQMTWNPTGQPWPRSEADTGITWGWQYRRHLSATKRMKILSGAGLASSRATGRASMDYFLNKAKTKSIETKKEKKRHKEEDEEEAEEKEEKETMPNSKHKEHKKEKETIPQPQPTPTVASGMGKAIPPWVDVANLRPARMLVDPTEEETKKLMTILRKRSQLAMAASQKYIFSNMKHMYKHKTLDVEHTATTRLFLQSHAKTNQKKKKRKEEDKRIETPTLKSNVCVSCKVVMLSNVPNRLGVMCETCINEQTDTDDREVKIHSHDVGCGASWSSCRCKLQRYRRHVQTTLDNVQSRRDKLWRNCYQCAGSIEDANRCRNSDCDFFYQREAVLLQIDEVGQRLEPFPTLLPTVEKWANSRSTHIMHVNGKRIDHILEFTNTFGLQRDKDYFFSETKMRQKYEHGSSEPSVLIRFSRDSDAWMERVSRPYDETVFDLCIDRREREVVRATQISNIATTCLFARRQPRIAQVTPLHQPPVYMEVTLCDGFMSPWVKERMCRVARDFHATIEWIPTGDQSRLDMIRQQQRDRPDARFFAVQQTMEKECMFSLEEVMSDVMELQPVVLRAKTVLGMRHFHIRVSACSASYRAWVDKGPGIWPVPLTTQRDKIDMIQTTTHLPSVLVGCVLQFDDKPTTFWLSELQARLVGATRAKELLALDWMAGPVVDAVRDRLDTQVDRELEFETLEQMQRLRGYEV